MIEWLVRIGAFRNANHAIWFIASFGFFLLYLNMAFRVVPLSALALVLAIVHAFPAVTAFTKKSASVSSEVYTNDCVWFNVVFVILYVALFFAR